jgi:hypothetical protein
MTDHHAPARPERIRMAAAAAITGKTARALQAMALDGAVPGAVKIGGEWTFDEARLRRWIMDLELASCRNNEKRPKTPSGAVASSGAGSRSRAGTPSGAYERAIQLLRQSGSKPNASAK